MEIRTVIEKYQQSIVDADVDLASQIWSTKDDVSFIHPRGHERGWGAVAKNFYGITMGDTFSERKMEIFDLSVHEDGDHAWVEFYWRFDAIMREDRTPLHTEGRETQVLRRMDRLGALSMSTTPVCLLREHVRASNLRRLAGKSHCLVAAPRRA